MYTNLEVTVYDTWYDSLLSKTLFDFCFVKTAPKLFWIYIKTQFCYRYVMNFLYEKELNFRKSVVIYLVFLQQDSPQWFS
jgi:hypothetical protein